MINEVQCCDYLDLLKQIPDNSVSAFISDPPFGIAYQNNYTHKKHAILKGDESKFSYLELAKEAFRILKPNSALFLYTGWSEYPDHYKQVESCGFTMKEPLIGQKRASGKTDLYGSFQSNCDWIIFAHKGRFKFKQTKLIKNKRAGVIPNKGRKPVALFKKRLPSCWFGEEYPHSTVNSSFQKKNDLFHPTIKNIEFMKWLILLSSDKDDIIVDPFCGTGTTLVAAKLVGRKFYGCDIVKEYVEMSCKRLSEV